MVEPLLHFILPYTILKMCNFSTKKAIFLSLFAIIPDLDVLFHVHRSCTHSAIVMTWLFSPLLIITFVYGIYQYRKHKSGGSQKAYGTVFIAYLIVLSHLFLDLLHTYTPILWPFIDKAYYVDIHLLTDMNNLRDLQFVFDIKTIPFEFGTVIIDKVDGFIFTSVGLSITIILIIGLVISEYKTNILNFWNGD